MFNYPQTQGGWQKFEGNPVLGNEKLGTCFDVHINALEKGFRMYFSWRPKKSLAFVESPDGIHWNDPTIILGPRPKTGWEDDINRNCVIHRNGKYQLWYTGQANGFSRIGYAESTDGLHYEKRLDQPVMIPELPWEKESVMNPFVIFDETRGIYRMWYAAGETYEPNALGYAESTDGISWKKSLINPIVVRGTKPCDQARVGGCEVIRLQDGSFIMFYIGYEDIDTARICAAKSPDGITRWKRLAANPIVSPGKSDDWDGSACYKPSALFDQAAGCWRLWYNGRNSCKEYIGMVTHPGYDLGPAEE